MMKKEWFIIFSILLIIPAVSANLQITVNPDTDAVIQDLSQPAAFNLDITNLGSTDSFEVYTLISGVEILPRAAFQIAGGQTVSIPIQIKMSEKVKRTLGDYNFDLNIRSIGAGIIYKERITVKISRLEEALSIIPESIKIDTETAVIKLQNNENTNFENLKIKFDSAFFETESIVNIPAKSTYEVSIPLDKNKIRGLIAGTYTLTTTIQTDSKKQKFQTLVKLIEKSGFSVKDESSGIIVTKRTIEKVNEGNIPLVAKVTLKKNLISRLVTSFNIEPYKVERSWFSVIYTWQKELKPAESITVTATTNWTFPLITLIAVLAIAGVVYYYSAKELELSKKVTFIKTKGGEFALKVTIAVSSKNFVEKVRIIDKLPPLVKLHDKFSSINPSKVDELNRRISWDIEALNPNETRYFSYIIFSKIGIVGKFALPTATAIYEREGKIKETESNQVFFIAERRQLIEE
jgi:hypothetical protein